MRRLALIAPLVLASAAAARGPGFWFTGVAPGSTGSGVSGLSQDGILAVGGSGGGADHIPGFTWTAAGGRIDFGLEEGMPFYTPAYGVSSDGTVVVGYTAEYDQFEPPYIKDQRAYRRVDNGSLMNLGVLPSRTRSYASSVSGDGSIVVGTCESSKFTNAYGEAFYWTEQTGMTGLGYVKGSGSLSKAHGVSRDASTIVGMSQSGGPSGDVEAFAWTQANGMKKLPDLPGAPPSSWCEANAVNADGSVAVGYARAAIGYDHPVRWVNGVPEDIAPALEQHAHARATDNSGAIIGGTINAVDAFVWTSATGLVGLADYLALHGIDVPADYQLREVRAISGDGLTFAGWARNQTTKVTEGFVATIPAACDADCDSSGELDIDDFICFQTLFGLSDPAADCDGSAELDIDDFICFQTAFGIGCP